MPFDGQISSFTREPNETKTPDVFSLGPFISWLENQPQETEFQYGDPADCVCARYCRDAGISYVPPGLPALVEDPVHGVRWATEQATPQEIVELAAADAPYDGIKEIHKTYGGVLSTALALRSASSGREGK